MKKWMMLGLGLMLAAGLSACGKKDAKVVNPEQTLDPKETIIWVDDSSIPLGDLQKEMERQMMNVPDGFPQDQLPDLQYRKMQIAIDNLLVRRLLEQEMKRSDVLISQADVEEAKKTLEASLGPGRTITMLIAEINLPMEVLEANLKLDIFKNKVLQEQYDAAWAEITEAYAKKYYDEHPDEFTQPEGRLASHILIRVSADADEATRAKAKTKAEEVRHALLEGADFAQVASEVSECVSRSRGGHLGLVPRGREAPAFEEAVYSQPLNQIGAVVETPVGYHIIKVTGEQKKELQPFDKVATGLINGLKRRAQERIISDYIKSLREKATIRFVGPLAPKTEEGATDAEAAPAEAAAQEAAPATEETAP